ncbi:MAG TPA: hypothetical protein VGB63_10395 [Pedobacter sp.]|jgi:hypothetical protein
MKFQLSFYLFLVLAVAACQKAEDPFVSKSVIDSLIARKNPVMKNVAFIFKNDIYYLPAFNQLPVRITNSPGVSKRSLSMSHNHKKFAYLSGSAIVIVDEKGSQLARLTQYSNVKTFDWSLNDETLYILTDNSMAYYGPSLNLPEITFPGINWAVTPQVLWASVSSKGDFAYVFTAFYPFGPDTYKLVVKRAGGGTDVVYTAEQNEKMSYAAFSVNEQDLVVGYKSNSYDRELSKLEIFSGLKSYPDFDLESSENYSTPRYNSKLDYMVCGYMRVNSDTLKLSARFGADFDKSKVREEFYTTGDFLYTDWK